MNNSDFKRPDNMKEGVLLNTNNEALSSYKKAKKRMSSVTKLETEMAEMKQQIQELQRFILNGTNTN